MKFMSGNSPHMPIAEHEGIEYNYQSSNVFENKPKSATNLYRVSKKMRHQSVNVVAVKQGSGVLKQNLSGSFADENTQMESTHNNMLNSELS